MPIISQYVDNSPTLILHYGENDIKMVVGTYTEGYAPFVRKCPGLFFMKDNGKKGYDPNIDDIKLIMKFRSEQDLDKVIDLLLETRNMFNEI